MGRQLNGLHHGVPDGDCYTLVPRRRHWALHASAISPHPPYHARIITAATLDYCGPIIKPPNTGSTTIGSRTIIGWSATAKCSVPNVATRRQRSVGHLPETVHPPDSGPELVTSL
jgi:hypothetical protein